MTRKELLVSYAMDFASFVMSEKSMKSMEIKAIILYGSVARGDFNKSSDVDMFIDIENKKEDKRIYNKDAKGLVESFYKSTWFGKWRRLGIENRISLLIGNLENWKDLRESILSNGIILYGKYKARLKGMPMALFSLDAIKPESKRVFILRKLFGYTSYGKRYKGLLEKYGGEKIAKGCFMVPIEHQRDIWDFLNKQKAKAQIRMVSVSE